MKRYIMRQKWLFLLTLGATFSFSFINTRNTILEQELIDAVLALDTDSVPRAMLLVLSFGALSGLVYMASQLLQRMFAIAVIDDMRNDVFSGVMQRSRKAFFSVNYSDYISAITNDLKLIRGQFIGMLFMTITFCSSLVLSGLLMFWYQPVVAVVAVLCAAAMTVLPMILGKQMATLSKAHSEKLAGLNTLLTELFSGFQVLHSFGVAGHARKKFAEYSTELKQAERKYDGMSTFSDAFAQFLSVMAQTFILVLSTWMVLQGRMSAGALVAFTSLNGNFCSALSMVLMGIPMLRGTKPIIERVNGFTQQEPLPHSGVAPSFAKKLEVKNLSFGYQAETSILDNISLTIRSGEKCALLGASGSGKTTLIRLLTGELDGYTGQILYDGTSLDAVNRDSVCHMASVIHQDVFLFDDTIRNNICLFDQFSDAEFERAIRLSGVQSFLQQFPEGAEYRVGQRGEFLSGGQKQRVAIARALIRNTPFLILDEGTSALDKQTAEEIEGELLAIHDLTLLTITHNLRNAETYDQIFHLEQRQKRA